MKLPLLLVVLVNVLVNVLEGRNLKLARICIGRPQSGNGERVQVSAKHCKTNALFHLSQPQTRYAMDCFTEKEKGELRGVRSRITKLMNQSFESKISKSSIEELRSQHNRFLAVAKEQYQQQEQVLPEQFEEAFSDYDGKLDIALRNQQMKDNLVDQQKHSEQTICELKKQVEQLTLQMKLSKDEAEKEKTGKDEAEKEKTGRDEAEKEKTRKNETEKEKDKKEEARKEKDTRNPQESRVESNPNVTIPPQPTHHPFYSKVPMSCLPKFDGTPADWPAYATTMEVLTLKNSHIEESQAKIMLLNSCKVGSAVHTKLSNMYSKKLSLEIMWTKLAERYSRTERSEMDLLEETCTAKGVSSLIDLEGIRDLYETSAKVEAMFTSLNNPPEILQQKLISIFVSKCHINLRYRLMQECRTLESLVQELDREWIIMQSHALSKPTPDESKPQQGRRVFAIQEEFKPHTNTRLGETTARDNSASPATIRTAYSPICYFCQSDGHFSDQCPVDHSDTQKLDLIRRRGLCWNCLKPGHDATNCKVKQFICRICQEPHKTVVHSVWLLFKTQQTNTKRFQAINTVSESHVNQDRKPSGLVMVNNSYCMVLLDTGSDCSIITGGLVKKGTTWRIKPIWFTPYESAPFAIERKTSLDVQCSDGANMKIEALVKKDHGPNHLILGMDYLSTLRLPPITTPFGTFAIGPKHASMDQALRLYNIMAWEEAPELTDRAEDGALMKVTFQDGLFVAHLPFVNEERPPNNFDSALLLLDRALSRMTPDLRQAYEELLYKYREEEHAVETKDPCGFFLPHFAVVKDSVTTKIRIVFDGSYGKRSLNVTLYKGVTPELKLEEKLLRLRNGKFAAVVDIEKAFLQISISPEHQRFLKFVWRTPQGEIKMFQFTRLPFGLVSSPAILEQCLSMVIDGLSRTAQELFRNAIYMDDAVLATDNEAQLTTTLKEATPVFAAHHFKLHKTVTNSKMIAAREDSLQGPLQKVLGLVWDTANDSLRLQKPKITPSASTKRYILHILGCLFDPLGFVDPIKLRLRYLISRSQTGLDEPLATDATNEITTFLHNLPLLEKIVVPRNCKGNRLLGFSDASQDAYGYCFFIADGERMTLLCAKSKIVPVNTERSTPQLELAALFIMSKKVVEILKTFGSKIEQIDLASDSTINLQRLSMELNKQKAFCSSKLIHILKLATLYDFNFHHVEGRHNPADEFSRYTTITDFMAKKERYDCPIPPLSKAFSLLKVFSIQTGNINIGEKTDSPLLALIKGDLSGTLSRVATFLEAIKRLRRRRSALTRTDRTEAMTFLIKSLQRDRDMEKLSIPVRKVDGIWMMRTRMINYSPIVFPSHPPLVTMLIEDVHRRFAHAGRDRVCAEISREFYVQGLRKQVKQCIDRCVFCTYARKAPINQPQGYWPVVRTEFTRAFEVIALDVFGPLLLRNRSKVYGLIAVCQVTRAVRLEVLPSLEAKEMLTALGTLFCSIGEPRIIFSDNGSNFRRVAKDCSHIILSLKKVLEGVVNWSFVPPDAPWFNATAERLIGAVKRVLATVGSKFVSHQELRHVFAQAERIVNSRVLFEVDGEAYTPYFLWQRRRPKPLVFKPIPNLLHPYKFSVLVNEETKRLKALWERNYRNLLALQSKDKRASILEAGQVVLVPEADRKRTQWSRGVITRVFPGPDHVIRVVELLKAGGVQRYCRPANGLILFEGNAKFLTPPPQDVADEFGDLK